MLGIPHEIKAQRMTGSQFGYFGCCAAFGLSSQSVLGLIMSNYDYYNYALSSVDGTPNPSIKETMSISASVSGGSSKLDCGGKTIWKRCVLSLYLKVFVVKEKIDWLSQLAYWLLPTLTLPEILTNH